jgi:hypothetical protein
MIFALLEGRDREAVTFSSLLLSSLELSGTKVYEPYVRICLEITARFCKEVILKLFIARMSGAATSHPHDLFWHDVTGAI